VVEPTLALQELTTAWSRHGRRTDMSLSSSAGELTAHYPPDAQLHPFQSSDPFTLMHVFPYQLALAKGLTKNRQLKVMLVEGWPASARMSRIWIGGDTTVSFPDSSVVDGRTGQWTAVTWSSAPGVTITVDGVVGPYRITTDKRGRIQGLETLFGMRWVRGSYDVSMNAFRQSIAAHIQAIRAAYPAVRALAAMTLPADSNVERRFVVSHRDGTRLAPGLLQLLAGGRQQVSGDTLIILAAGAPQTAGQPAIGTAAASVDPLIPVLAKFTDSGNPGGRPTIDGLLKFVRARVTIDTAANAPEDGRIALDTRRGRPDAVARLFVGLAQAANLTARYVVGVRPEGDLLLTHAWAEVLNSRGDWVAVDPVLGLDHASTSLIRLGWGGSSYPEDMLPMLANAKFTLIPSGRVP
jgi:hypothetical protein